MGLWFLEAWGEFDIEVCEEIAKQYKVDVKLVQRHYKKMIETIKNEKED